MTERPKTRTGAAEWRTRLGLAALSIIVFGGAAEIGARLLFRMVKGYSYAEHSAFVPHPELVFQNNPRYHLWRKRPADRFDFFFIPPLAPTDERPRLWVLGGSTSAAMPDGSDWPAMLQEDVRDFRVVNMGHEGYGTDQLRRVFERYDSTIHPEAVVVFDGWNYRGASSSGFAFQPWNATAPRDSWPRKARAFLLNHSAAYGWPVHAFHRRYVKDTGGSLEPYPEMKEWEEDLRQALREMTRHERVFLVIPPGLAMRDDVRSALTRTQHACADHFAFYRSEYEKRRAVLERVSRELGVPVLDLRTPYLRLSADQLAVFFRDACHQTREGNRFFTNEIHAELSRSGALSH